MARAASRRCAERTGNGTYTYGSPRARNAALCMSGERLWATGSPKMPITRVAPVTRLDGGTAYVASNRDGPPAAPAGSPARLPEDFRRLPAARASCAACSLSTAWAAASRAIGTR